VHKSKLCLYIFLDFLDPVWTIPMKTSCDELFMLRDRSQCADQQRAASCSNWELTTKLKLFIFIDRILWNMAEGDCRPTFLSAWLLYLKSWYRLVIHLSLLKRTKLTRSSIIRFAWAIPMIVQSMRWTLIIKKGHRRLHSKKLRRGYLRYTISEWSRYHS